jgi:hypothetical protein
VERQLQNFEYTDAERPLQDNSRVGVNTDRPERSFIEALSRARSGSYDPDTRAIFSERREECITPGNSSHPEVEKPDVSLRHCSHSGSWEIEQAMLRTDKENRQQKPILLLMVQSGAQVSLWHQDPSNLQML